MNRFQWTPLAGRHPDAQCYDPMPSCVTLRVADGSLQVMKYHVFNDTSCSRCGMANTAEVQRFFARFINVTTNENAMHLPGPSLYGKTIEFDETILNNAKSATRYPSCPNPTAHGFVSNDGDNFVYHAAHAPNQPCTQINAPKSLRNLGPGDVLRTEFTDGVVRWFLNDAEVLE